MKVFRSLLIAVFCFAGVGVDAAEIRFKLFLRDAENKEPVAGRCELTDPTGKHYFPVDHTALYEGAPKHFYAWDEFSVDLKTDIEYTLKVDKGFGWIPSEIAFTLDEESERSVVALQAWYRPEKRRWLSGDFDGRLSYVDPALPMAAAGLNTVCRVVDSETANDDDEKMSKGFFHLSNERAYTGRDWGFDDFNIVKTALDVAIHETPFNSTQLQYMEAGKKIAGVIDVIRPDGPEIPVAAALGLVDTVRVVGPEAVGKPLPSMDRVLERLDGYYDLLNCGFKIPVSAGSMATQQNLEEEDRLGSSRLFCRIPADFSLGYFFRMATFGRSWATNGPVLSFRVGSKDPGYRFELPSDNRKAIVNLGARSTRPLDRIDLLHNGEIVGSATPDSASPELIMKNIRYSITKPGWMVARVFEKQENPEAPPRYAHSSPVYFDIAGKKPIVAETVQNFATRITEDIQRISTDESIPDYEKKRVLALYSQARDKYLELLR